MQKIVTKVEMKMIKILSELAEQFISSLSNEEKKDLEQFPQDWDAQGWKRMFASKIDIVKLSIYDIEEIERDNMVLPEEIQEAIHHFSQFKEHEFSEVEVVFPRNYKPSAPLPDADEYRWIYPIQYWVAQSQ
jgi:hypothetical protein